QSAYFACAVHGDKLMFFFFQAEDGIRDFHVTGVQTCALPILPAEPGAPPIPLSPGGPPDVPPEPRPVNPPEAPKNPPVPSETGGSPLQPARRSARPSAAVETRFGLVELTGGIMIR